MGLIRSLKRRGKSGNSNSIEILPDEFPNSILEPNPNILRIRTLDINGSTVNTYTLHVSVLEEEDRLIQYMLLEECHISLNKYTTIYDLEYEFTLPGSNVQKTLKNSQCIYSRTTLPFVALENGTKIKLNSDIVAVKI